MFHLTSLYACPNCKNERIRKLTELPRACPRCGIVNIRSSILIAATLFFLDALLFNQGIIAILTLITIVLLRLPMMTVALYKKDAILLKNRAARTGIYAAMAAMVLGLNFLNNRHAKNQAEIIITACQQYENKHQKFPDKLEDLVPDFVTKVPRAKYIFGPFGKFNYWIYDNKHWVQYTYLPPFGRFYYILEEGGWKYMD